MQNLFFHRATITLTAVIFLLGVGFSKANAGFLTSLIKKQENTPTTSNSTKKKIATSSNSKTLNYELVRGQIENHNFPMHIITLDLHSSEFDPSIRMASEKFGKAKTLSTLCEENNAVAGINGAFFQMKNKHPRGYLILDGKPVKAPLALKERTTLGIMKDGNMRIGKPKFRRRIRPEKEYFSIVDDINEKCTNWQIILFNEQYGKTVKMLDGSLGFRISPKGFITETYTKAGSIPIPDDGSLLVAGGMYAGNFKNTRAGHRITLTQTLMPPWENIESGFGSVVSLVQDGKISYDPVKESVAGSGILGKRARSMAGITKDNKLLLVATDTEGNGFEGLTMTDCAELMKALGAQDAVALDGGGSTTIWYRGQIKNRLAKGKQRPIATALLIVPEGN